MLKREHKEYNSRKNKENKWYRQLNNLWLYDIPFRGYNIHDKYGKEWIYLSAPGCLYYQRYTVPWTDHYEPRKGTKIHRAGILLKDINFNFYLLVQSYGNKWGIPMGYNEGKEQPYETAQREFKEETGKLVGIDRTTPHLRFENSYIYLIKHETDYMRIYENLNIIDDEITAIGLVNSHCIREMYRNNLLNETSKRVFKRLKVI